MTEKDNITLAEYQNYINDSSEPKGHGKKALAEYCDILSNKYNVTCICANEYSSNIPKVNYSYCIRSVIRSEKHRFKRTLTIWKNIYTIFKNNESQIIWFTNVDWMLLVYLAWHIKKEKIVITLFRDIYEDTNNDKWKAIRKPFRYLINKGTSKVDLAFVTNPNLRIDYIRNVIHVPDFYATKEYTQFIHHPKEDRIICLGLMHDQKDLKSLVEHFNNSNIRLYIIGDFLTREYYREIRSLVNGNNIIIENRRVPEDEYIELIGTSKFVIMPYKAEQYGNATSGILLETIFCGSVPIAPKFLLKNNNVNGIGYNVLAELPTDINEYIKIFRRISNDITPYSIENVSTSITCGLEKL